MCIQAPDELEFGIFYGVSNNTWRFWDISNSEKLIGYQPQDNAENWR
jgi:uronate dehydrogenase